LHILSDILWFYYSFIWNNI